MACGLYCLRWDVKPYSLTHCIQRCYHLLGALGLRDRLLDDWWWWGGKTRLVPRHIMATTATTTTASATPTRTTCGRCAAPTT